MVPSPVGGEGSLALFISRWALAHGSTQSPEEPDASACRLIHTLLFERRMTESPSPASSARTDAPSYVDQAKIGSRTVMKGEMSDPKCGRDILARKPRYFVGWGERPQAGMALCYDLFFDWIDWQNPCLTGRIPPSRVEISDDPNRCKRSFPAPETWADRRIGGLLRKWSL